MKGKFYKIIDPKLTDLAKGQVIHEDDLERAKKENNWGENELTTFTYEEFKELNRPLAVRGEKLYEIVEPGLCCLNKEQVINGDELEKAKKEYDWKEDYQTFSFKEFKED